MDGTAPCWREFITLRAPTEKTMAASPSRIGLRERAIIVSAGLLLAPALLAERASAGVTTAFSGGLAESNLGFTGRGLRGAARGGDEIGARVRARAGIK